MILRTLPPPPARSSLPAPPPPPARRRGRKGRLAAFIAVALAAGSLVIDRSPLVAVVALFVLVVPFEKLFPRHRQTVRRPGLGTDLAYLFSQPLLGAAGIVVAFVVGVASLAWLPGLALSPLVGALPPLVQIAFGVALFDLAVYWAHRWYHEVPFLWRFHSIHHSSPRLDWVSGVRTHPLDGALIGPAFVLLLAAGFSPQVTGTVALVQIVSGLFLHANVRWRLRPLHRIIATPEFHHWHHANEPDAINTNYSAFLPVWDLVFRTYHLPRDRRPQRYGVSEHVPTGLIAQLRHPLRGLGNPRWWLRHPIRETRLLARSIRRGLGQIRRSTFRPRRIVTF